MDKTDLKIAIRTTADIDGVLQADKALTMLDSTAGKTAAQTQTLSTGVTQVDKSTRNSSQSLLLFSQGFEDAQYGIRGVMNNIPGLVVALGGTAGLAGAISIAAVSFSVLYEWLGKTVEKAGDVEAKLDAVATRIAKVDSERLAKLEATIDARTDASIALREDLLETTRADEAAAVSVLSNAAKIALAQANIAAALGLQVSHYNDIAKVEAAAAQKRELLAQQAIAAEKRRLAEAFQAEEDAERRAEDARAKRDETRALLAAARAKQAAFRASQLALEKTAKEKADFGSSELAFSGEENPLATDTAAREARANLDAPEFKKIGEILASRVQVLEESVKKFGGESGTVARAEVALEAASNKVADVEAAVSRSIETVEQNFAADNLLARSQSLAQKSQQFATDIKTAVSDVESGVEVQRSAKETLMAAAADGVITATEQRAVADSIRTLLGGLQAGITTTNGNMQKLIKLYQGLQTKQLDLQGQINGLPR